MVGSKRALKPQQVWAIRFWLDREGRLRDRALLDLTIDSKLRGCDVVQDSYQRVRQWRSGTNESDGGAAEDRGHSAPRDADSGARDNQLPESRDSGVAF